MRRQTIMVLAQLVLFPFVIAACQHQKAVPSVDLEARVLGPIRWEFQMITNAGTYCETIVPIEIVAPKELQGRRVDLIIQEGFGSKRHDWIAEGTIWRPVGSTLLLRVPRSEVIENYVRWRDPAHP